MLGAITDASRICYSATLRLLSAASLVVYAVLLQKLVKQLGPFPKFVFQHEFTLNNYRALSYTGFLGAPRTHRASFILHLVAMMLLW